MRGQVSARDTRMLRTGDELPTTGNELLKHWRHRQRATEDCLVEGM